MRRANGRGRLQSLESVSCGHGAVETDFWISNLDCDHRPRNDMSMTFKSIAAIPILALLLLAASGCQGPRGDEAGSSSDLRRVTLALNWFPEVEHGGFYAAQVHGFFQEEGLEVKILPGGPGAPVIQQVATQRVDFAITNADEVLLGRDQGARVVAVMAAMQDSPRCIMVHEKSGISSLMDLRNVTLAIGSGKPFAQFLLSKLGDAQVTIVPYQGNVTGFLQRSDYAQQAYVFSEPCIARQQGGDPKCLLLSEIGFNPYSSTLISSEQLLEEHPELMAKVVRASVRGWRKYLEDPLPTNRWIHKLNSEMSPEILAFGAEAIRPLCLPGGHDSAMLGAMSSERWETLAGQLRSIGLLEDPTAWVGAFDTRFLPSELQQ